MNKLVIFVIILSLLEAFFIGFLFFHFNNDISTSSDKNLLIACTVGCNNMGLVYEEKYNLTQDFDTFNDCSRMCMGKSVK